MFKKLIFLILCTYITDISAQVVLHTHSAKAKKHNSLALNYFRNSNFKEAEKEALVAYRKDSTFVENLILLAQIYQEQALKVPALRFYTKSIKYGARFYPELYMYRGNLLYQLGKYQQAKSDFSSLSDLVSDKKLLQKLTRKIKKAQIADSLLQHPLKFNPVNLGDSINTPLDEYSPLLTFNNDILIFTRAQSMSEYHEEDLYISKKEKNGWRKAQNAGSIFNTGGNEGSPSISADNRFLVFASCNRPDGFGRCDIYISEFNGYRWNKPKNIGKPINSRYWESQPCLSADGSTLYFVSNRVGGFGKADIWMSRKDERSQWRKPTNLGRNINTAGNEYYPFLHANGQNLYFASEGWPGLGETDIFYSQLDSTGKWSVPKNIGYPINSSQADNGLFISANGETAFLATNRFSTRKDLDIFQFKMDTKIRPQAAKHFKGIIIDSLSRKPLFAKVLIKNNRKQYSATHSLKQNGSFEYLSIDCKYIEVYISVPHYIFYTQKIDNPFNKSIHQFALLPIKNKSKSIFHFNFSFDSSLLDSSEFETLNYLADFLFINKDIKISIEGHTDSKGSKTYNMSLSLERAKAVQKYLIVKGIPQKRLDIKAFGASKPIAPNNNEKNRALNRRTEIIYLVK